MTTQAQIEKLLNLHTQILQKSIQIFTRGDEARKELESLMDQKEKLILELTEREEKKKRLAGYLLNLYLTGAGDAGTEETIYTFHEIIGNEDKIDDALEHGKYTIIPPLKHRISQTDYFLGLAEKILKDLDA